MPDAPGDRARPVSSTFIKSPLDLGAGLFLMGIGLLGFYGSLGLRFGALTTVGSGLMPRSVAVLVGIFGLGIALSSLFFAGPRLERWGFRGPFFVLGAVIIFALTIRGSTLSVGEAKLVIPQLGLAISGPLAIIFSALADRDTRPVELIVFATVLTILCIGMFRFLLRLPIPILPVGFGHF